MKKLVILASVVLFFFGSVFFTSCIKPKDPLKLNKALQELVIRKAIEKKFKNSKLEIIPYSFNLDVKGNVGYEENIKADLDVKLKGNNALDVKSGKVLTNLKDLNFLGVKGAVDIKGQVSALGVIINVNEHFNF